MSPLEIVAICVATIVFLVLVVWWWKKDDIAHERDLRQINMMRDSSGRAMVTSWA